MPRAQGTGCAIVFMVLFLTLWCGVTGAFVALQISTAWQVVDAGLRYRQVAGTVLGNEVERGPEATAASADPRSGIAYRYVVDEHAYVGSRHRFGQQQADAGGTVARRFPPGAAVVVHYDPRKPQDAVIDPGWPPDYWFMWLFLQPFLLIAVLLLAGVVITVVQPSALRRAVSGTWAPGWRIPGWGTVTAAGEGGLRVGGGHAPGEALSVMLVAHGAICFVSIFVLGILGHVAGDPQGSWSRGGPLVGTVLLLSLAGSAAVAHLTRQRRARPVLHLDPVARQVEVTTPAAVVSLPFSGISAWEVRVVDALRSSAKHGVFLAPLGGDPLLLLATDERELASHVARELGRVTGALVRLPPS